MPTENHCFIVRPLQGRMFIETNYAINMRPRRGRTTVYTIYLPLHSYRKLIIFIGSLKSLCFGYEKYKVCLKIETF